MRPYRVLLDRPISQPDKSQRLYALDTQGLDQPHSSRLRLVLPIELHRMDTRRFVSTSHGRRHILRARRTMSESQRMEPAEPIFDRLVGH